MFFAQEKIAGIGFDDGLISVARCRFDRRGRLRLEKAAWTECNPRATPAEISSTIRQLWRKYKPGTFTVAFSLRSRSLILKYFKYTGIREEDLEGTLQLEAEECLQSDPNEVVFDRHLVRMNEDSDALSGILTAVPRKEVDTHFNILKHAALYPVGCGVSAFAVAELFRAMHGVPRESAAGLVRLAAGSADIVMLYGDNGIYPRTVFVPSSQASRPAKYFAESINDVISYYCFKLHLPDIEKLYLTGLVDDEVLGHIKESTGLPVELWEPLKEVYAMPRQLHERLERMPSAARSSLTVAMGMSLK